MLGWLRFFGIDTAAFKGAAKQQSEILMQTNAKSFDIKHGNATQPAKQQLLQQHQQYKLKSKMQSGREIRESGLGPQDLGPGTRDSGPRALAAASWFARPWRNKTNESASIFINYLNAAGMEMASSLGIKATAMEPAACSWQLHWENFKSIFGRA